MAQRLTLSTVGIKSPLDINHDGYPKAAKAQAADDLAAPSLPKTRSASSTPPKNPARSALKIAEPTGAAARFYGAGRPVQTSVALDQDCSQRLAELARATGASVNALAVAAIHTGLPAKSELAQQMILEERLRRAGTRHARLEQNLRLPQQLRTRADELVSAARSQVPRATRADLLNAALRRGLPTDAQPAAQLVARHAQQTEQAAVAP